jgi:hypothetical protein
MLTNKYYVYVYFDPRRVNYLYFPDIGFEPFYVGKGSKNRYLDHLHEKHTKNRIKASKIQKIRTEGFEPIIVKISENLSEIDAYNLEAKLITEIGRIILKTGPLSNLTDGGRGPIGQVMSDETKAKMSKAHKGRIITWRDKLSKANLGKCLSEKTKQKISDKLTGRIFSDETKEKMSESLMGHIVTDTTKQKISEARKEFFKREPEKALNSCRGMLGKTLSEESKAKMIKSLKEALAKPETKDRRSKANAGGNNPRAKPCKIFDKEYSCLGDAMADTGLSKYVIKGDESFSFL